MELMVMAQLMIQMYMSFYFLILSLYIFVTFFILSFATPYKQINKSHVLKICGLF